MTPKPKLIDPGTTFAKLTVIAEGPVVNGTAMWLCDCDCGTSGILVSGTRLRVGRTKSCGCLSTGPRQDLTARQFGALVVTQTGPRVHGRVAWLCRCECGAVKAFAASELLRGSAKSCGCMRAAPRLDLTGQMFGRLTATRRIPGENGAEARWLCECSCGGTSLSTSYNLQGGHTRSCGCLAAETRSAPRVHGHAPRNGDAHPLYSTWQSMLTRCTNENAQAWKYYGAKGVTVCDRWRNDFAAFLADMGERPEGKTLDRIDPFGNYEPGNCRWATGSEQALNKRNSVANRNRVLAGQVTP